MPTANLSLPYLEAGQAQKHVTHNEALRILDAVVQLAVVAISASPPGAPADGERHIVGAGATGVFAGHENEVAAFQDGAWIFLAPVPGWRAWNAADGTLHVWNGAAWSGISGGGGGSGDVSGPAGGTTPGLLPIYGDTTGKLLARKANSYLFDGERVADGGTGNAQVQVSKEAAGDTASWFFATDHAPRGEIGFIEDDDQLRFKMHNGSGWIEAMSIARTTGQVLINGSPPRERLTANRTYYVRSDGNDANDGLTNSAGGAFLTIQKAINVAFGTLDLGGFNVTIQVGPGIYGPFTVSNAQVGAGLISVVGDPTIPSNCVISGGSFNGVVVQGSASLLAVDGFQITTVSSGANCVFVQNFGQLNINNIWFSTASGSHISTQLFGLVLATGSYRVLGNATNLVRVTTFAAVNMFGSNWTVPSATTVTYSDATAAAYRLGNISALSVTFTITGTVTGSRYKAETNSVIFTAGAGANYFPGNGAGTTTTGGQYG